MKVPSQFAGPHLERVVTVGRDDAVQAAPAVLALAVYDAARLQQALILQQQQQQQQRGVPQRQQLFQVWCKQQGDGMQARAPPPGAGAAVLCSQASAGRSKAPCGSCCRRALPVQCTPRCASSAGGLSAHKRHPTSKGRSANARRRPPASAGPPSATWGLCRMPACCGRDTFEALIVCSSATAEDGNNSSSSTTAEPPRAAAAAAAHRCAAAAPWRRGTAPSVTQNQALTLPTTAGGKAAAQARPPLQTSCRITHLATAASRSSTSSSSTSWATAAKPVMGSAPP